jgi:hypothetical protein
LAADAAELFAPVESPTRQTGAVAPKVPFRSNHIAATNKPEAILDEESPPIRR